MTLLCCICQMQEDPGVYLGIVAQLKFCDMHVGEHGLEASDQRELFAICFFKTLEKRALGRGFRYCSKIL